MTNTTFSVSYHAKEVASVLAISGSTLRKWCLEFEKQDYMFDRGVNNTRYFTADDLVLLHRVKEQLQDHHRTLQDAVTIVLTGIEEEQRATSVLDDFKGEQQNNMMQIILDKLEKQEEFNKALLNELRRQQERQEQEQKALPSPTQQRLDRFNSMIAERRVISVLENEALKLWDDKPDNERFIKIGWFKKIEDIAKRDRFVKNYIDEHFEERLGQEFDFDDV